MVGAGSHGLDPARSRRHHQSVRRSLHPRDARGQPEERHQGVRSRRSGPGHFARGCARARHGAAGRHPRSSRQPRQHGRRPRCARLRLRYHRARPHPRDPGDRDEAAEEHADPARGQARRSCQREGCGAAHHRRDRRRWRTRPCRRVCGHGGARHADGTAHDAVQPQHRDGRTLRLRRAGWRDVRLDRRPALRAERRNVGSRAWRLARA